ncbi:MAG TPA: hypothetical protein VGY49_07735 [Burkholderiaceae bacterium]|jgi:hypothetical protein|nr:hypothetical protein [Burkholderiaceae bacterium]
MAKVTSLQKYARAKKAKPAARGNGGNGARPGAARVAGAKSGAKDIDHFIKTAGLDSQREKEIGQHIGYRYDVNLVPDYRRLTPFLRKYMDTMQWRDLNWLEDVHLGYEEGRAAVFDRNVNGWVTVPEGVKLPDNQQDRDMLARELLIKFQMSPRHPLVDLHKAYRKF